MRRVALAGFALLCFCLASAQQPGPRALKLAPRLPAVLKTALRAVGKTKYAGTRIVEARAGANGQRHVERVLVDGYRTRIEFPEASPLHGEIIVETAKERRQFLPSRNEIRVMPPRREEALARIAQLGKRRLSFKEAAGGKVAGLDTQRVDVADPNGRVLQSLWIEPKSGIILKREINDRTGKRNAYFEFTQIDLTPQIKASDFALTVKGAQIVTPQRNLERVAKRGGFLGPHLPNDSEYQLEAARIQKIAGMDVLVQQYVGHGRRITLYELRADIDPNRLGRLAPANIHTTAWRRGGSSFALVGDVAQAELEDLAARLRG